MTLLRTTRSRICPICQKPDWCSISENGEFVICMRVQNRMQTRNGGYMHFLDGQRPKHMEIIEAPQKLERLHLDWTVEAYECSLRLGDVRMEQLVSKWGLSSPEPLKQLKVGWAPYARAYTFPMRDGGGTAIGIHLRYTSGEKLCMKGSKLGLFLPGKFDWDYQSRLYICEGASDTAVLIDRGLRAIGRPSNVGSVDHVVDFCKSDDGLKEVVLVTDRDKPGSTAADCTERGRRTLVASLRAIRCRVKCIRPPGHNDVREWAPSRETLEAVTEAAKWQR